MAAATLPSGPRGRALALGITAAAALLLWFSAVAPLIELYRDRADRLGRREQLAQRMAQLAATLPRLKALAAAGAAKGGRPILALEGSSDAVAAATLENMVHDMATAVDASFTSVESIPAESAGDYRKIGIKLSLTTSWPVLAALLQSVEASSMPMLIDDLRIHVASQATATTARMLQANFAVYAFRAAVTPAGDKS